MQTSSESYYLTSERIGFRVWHDDDWKRMFQLCTNEEVMRFFPALLTEDQCRQFISKMQSQFEQHGFCYFATELKETGEFIGFIGLMEQNYDAPFTPCIDIGWRLLPGYWGKGLATEGAKRILQFAEAKGVSKIIATAPELNLPSIRVMVNAGMQMAGKFKHPRLADHPDLQPCVWYEYTTNRDKRQEVSL